MGGPCANASPGAVTAEPAEPGRDARADPQDGPRSRRGCLRGRAGWGRREVLGDTQQLPPGTCVWAAGAIAGPEPGSGSQQRARRARRAGGTRAAGCWWGHRPPGPRHPPGDTGTRDLAKGRRHGNRRPHSPPVTPGGDRGPCLPPSCFLRDRLSALPGLFPLTLLRRLRVTLRCQAPGPWRPCFPHQEPTAPTRPSEPVGSIRAAAAGQRAAQAPGDPGEGQTRGQRSPSPPG